MTKYSVLPQPVSVKKTVLEAPDVKSLYLDMEVFDKTRYVPGRFLMIYVWGVGEIPLSLSEIGAEDGLIGVTVKAVGAVSRYIVDNVVENSVVGYRGPYGNGWSIDGYEGWNILIIAGGVGIAPLRPLINHVLRNIDKCSSLTILYGARDPDHILYKNDFSK